MCLVLCSSLALTVQCQTNFINLAARFFMRISPFGIFMHERVKYLGEMVFLKLLTIRDIS